MTLRIATFNVENLMNRFDFSGVNNNSRRDRSLLLYDIKSDAEYRLLEKARAIAQTDDTRQLTALAIADTHADIICLQEVDNIDALHAFEYNYLFKMVGAGYRKKYMVEGNDSRGIDVAVMMKEETASGEKIEFIKMQSHKDLTYADIGLEGDVVETNKPSDKIFKRDCLEIDVTIGERPLTIYVVHFKSMGGARNGLDGRTSTMPVRRAEAKAVRHIIEERFGKGKTDSKRFVICGDMNDYQEKVVVGGNRVEGFNFSYEKAGNSAVDVFTGDGFCHNPMSARAELDRWTLYHSRGEKEQHLCQLDYILLSPSLARLNDKVTPSIVRGGQPFRTPFPDGNNIERYPRVGWDRPKASDHCPIFVSLDKI